MVKITKRNGDIVDFDGNKILSAINKANREVEEQERVDEGSIQQIIKVLLETAKQKNSDGEYLGVEDIQDTIENWIISEGKGELAKKYIIYRYEHKLAREKNTTDDTIKEFLDGESEYWNTENSNKNPMLVTTQRDYLAGITSTDLTRRFLLPSDVVKAHDEGILHFHKKIVA